MVNILQADWPPRKTLRDVDARRFAQSSGFVAVHRAGSGFCRTVMIPEKGAFSGSQDEFGFTAHRQQGAWARRSTGAQGHPLFKLVCSIPSR
jgi:hypothetical protein